MPTASAESALDGETSPGTSPTLSTNPFTPPSTPKRLGQDPCEGGAKGPQKVKKMWMLPSPSSLRSPTPRIPK